MKGIPIKGVQISLRSVDLNDADNIVSYFNSAKENLGAHTLKDTNTKKQRKYIEKNNSDSKRYYFGVILNETEMIIGTILLKDIDLINKTAVTSTFLGEMYTNKGYGTEAKHLLLDFAFNNLNLKTIYSHVYSYNEHSRAYSLFCGYTHVNTLKEKIFYNKKYWDEWVLSITKERWLPIWENYKKKHGL